MNATTENTNEINLIALAAASPPPVRLRKVRHSKIGRLPRVLLDQLCQRLEEGQAAPEILDWVNGLSEVRQLLEREFAGRPITPQNLSDWRADGYLDWVRMEEARDYVNSLQAYGEVMSPEQQKQLADQISRVFAIELFATLRTALDATQTPLERFAVLHKGIYDIQQLRRSDHSAVRSAIEQERWEFERQDLTEARAEKDKSAAAAHQKEERDRQKSEEIGRAYRESERILQELMDDGQDADAIADRGHEAVQKAYAALQARKAGASIQPSGGENREESKGIVQNRGKSKVKRETPKTKLQTPKNLQPLSANLTADTSDLATSENIQQPKSNTQHPVTEEKEQNDEKESVVEQAAFKPVEVAPEDPDKVIAELVEKAKAVGLVPPGPGSYEQSALRAYLTGKPADWYSLKTFKIQKIQPASVDPRLDPSLRWFEIIKKWDRLNGPEAQLAALPPYKRDEYLKKKAA